MVRKKRAKKKMFKAELTASVQRHLRNTSRIIEVLSHEQEPTVQLNEIRSVLGVEPVEYKEHKGIEMKPEQDKPLTGVKPTKGSVQGDATATVATPADDVTTTDLTGLRLDIATSLYAHLCRRAESADIGYETLLVQQLEAHLADSQELDTNDFATCETKQRVYIQLTQEVKEMVDSLAKQLKLPKRAVVETICSTHIRKGVL